MERPLRAVLWQGLFLPGSEWCQLAGDASGWRIDGTVTTAVADAPVLIRYGLALHSDWATREVEITMHSGVAPREQRLRLTVDADHRWHVERSGMSPQGSLSSEAEAVRGLVDVDLGFSPVTNTLPIRRLAPGIGDAVDVTAAWVRVPELTVEPLPQRYTRLTDRRYRYESAGGAFVAELEVDDLGLVVTYEGGWQRIATASAAQ
jgi:hypothetical protein